MLAGHELQEEDEVDGEPIEIEDGDVEAPISSSSFQIKR